VNFKEREMIRKPISFTIILSFFWSLLIGTFSCVYAQDTTTRYPVYRFFNIPVGSAHFYTINEDEKNAVLDLYSDVFNLESVAWYAHLNELDEPEAKPVYRFLNLALGSVHFYTISEEEKNTVITNYPNIFEYEGIAYYAYAPGDQPIGAYPVYRFLNLNLGSTHFYTISEEEKNAVITNYPDIFKYEGIAFYAFDRPVPTDNDADGYFTDDGDCNDNDATVYPGAEEICSDGIDNDCDGDIDEGCSSMYYPISMAAAGDSITVAYNADGTSSLLSGQTYEQYEVSWALGDSIRVNSQAQRLSELNPAFIWDAEYDNYAVAGANIIDLQEQVTQIVDYGPYDYVVIFIGHNDICDASIPENMLDDEIFAERFTAAMDILYSQIPPPDVAISSLAKVSNLYNAGKNDSWCNLIWSLGDICRVVTSGNSEDIAAADLMTQEYNYWLGYYADVYGYRYVPQIYDATFTRDDLSDFDCFHPNVIGQNRIADIIWMNGLYGSSQ
jgi:lysophospholipase L1-like esterase